MSDPMTWDDVQDAIDHYRAGHLQLRAVAWSFRRFRQQDGRDVTPAELMETAGASQTAAYRAIQEINRHSRISGNSRFPVPGKREKDSRKAGIPPHPPIEERESEQVVVGGAAHAHEPFETPATIPTRPLPQGRTSPEAAALADRFARHGSTDDGTPYSRVVANLCDCHRADWVGMYFECQLERWNRRPGYSAAAKTLAGWNATGEPGWRYRQELDARPEPGPPTLRPTGTDAPQRSRVYRNVEKALEGL